MILTVDQHKQQKFKKQKVALFLSPNKYWHQIQDVFQTVGPMNDYLSELRSSLKQNHFWWDFFTQPGKQIQSGMMQSKTMFLLLIKLSVSVSTSSIFNYTAVTTKPWNVVVSISISAAAIMNFQPQKDIYCSQIKYLLTVLLLQDTKHREHSK